MRASHTPHPLPAFPVFSSAFVSSNEVVLGGGGGASRSGIKNKLRIYRVDEDRSLHLLNELELENDEDAPMSMAAHIETKSIICGINSAAEKLEKGQNENCRVFELSGEKHMLTQSNAKGTLLSGDADDYQKVTVISPDGSLLVVAGNREFVLLSYPSLSPVASPINVNEGDIYDATFSPSYLVVATSVNLLVYAITATPSDSSQGESGAEKSSKKKKGKQKLKDNNAAESSLPALELVAVVPIPSLPGVPAGAKITFRAAKFHPSQPTVLYTMLNTVPPRKRNTKSVTRQAYVVKWTVEASGDAEEKSNLTLKLDKTRKAGEGGVTCFDISPNGKYLALGSSNYAIEMLDSITLSPLLTILKAHDFPLTTLCFNPTSQLLVSGSADSTVRVVTVPDQLGGQSWSSTLFVIIAIIILLVAIALMNK